MVCSRCRISFGLLGLEGAEEAPVGAAQEGPEHDEEHPKHHEAEEKYDDGEGRNNFV